MTADEESTSVESTQILVRAWQAGDQDAFASLERKLAPLLAYRISRHRSWPRVAGQQEVVDVVQDIWHKVLDQSPSSFEPKGKGSDTDETPLFYFCITHS